MSTTTDTIVTTELPAAGTYGIDASHSHLGFKVRHLMVSKVRGRFADFEGTVTIADNPVESSLEVVVQLASIDTKDAGRDEHLRSADFFNVETTPTMTYSSTGVRESGKGTFVVDGDLTLNGITKPVALAVELEGVTTDPWGNERAGFSATTSIDREEFGVTWNQALETGGVMLGKKIDIEIEAEIVKQA
jgi:polyisoprenoid-binding protein YceI